MSNTQIRYADAILIIITALCLVGVIGLLINWIFFPDKELPFLNWILVSVIAPIAGVFVLIAKGKINLSEYEGAEQKHFKTDEDRTENTISFLSDARKIDILSSKISWISANQEIQNLLKQKAKSGGDITIYLEKMNETAKQLQDANVKIRTYHPKKITPKTRFIMLNRGTAGQQALLLNSGTDGKYFSLKYCEPTSNLIIGFANDVLDLLE